MTRHIGPFIWKVENVTSSTKPEVRNVSQYRQKRIEPQTYSTYKENLVKLTHLVHGICINHPHPYIYLNWEFGQDREKPIFGIFAYHPESCNLSPRNLWGYWTEHHKICTQYTKIIVTNPNGIQIQSAILPQYTLRTDRQADRPTNRQIGLANWIASQCRTSLPRWDDMRSDEIGEINTAFIGQRPWVQDRTYYRLYALMYKPTDMNPNPTNPNRHTNPKPHHQTTVPELCGQEDNRKIGFSL